MNKYIAVYSTGRLCPVYVEHLEAVNNEEALQRLGELKEETRSAGGAHWRTSYTLESVAAVIWSRGADNRVVSKHEPPLYSREDLISLCEDAIRPESVWHDRDSEQAHRQVGEAWALLKAGCEFTVLDGQKNDGSFTLVTDNKTIWVEIRSRGFAHFDWGGDYRDDSFYIPTRQRLDTCGDKDWY